MISVQIPQAPIAVTGWEEPTDPDLKWISLGNYQFCALLEALRVGGYQVKQLQESDAQSLIDDANTNIAAMVAAIDSMYVPGK
jgi:hypothetical protein